ncbi:hypothetical protein [Sphingomonas sp. NIBR02145]|uniref:hypothetical protein n=1 Tax=Sphingomonas sp. NIBR02145 TaxID=3014784 RepID=UPI0022B4A8FE|nr:hypothetical protein [Sphingomonas sp. NIBR02145]WHU03469.1 hypothetical protein O3305_02360 [Sphingomonas sp. NIBR02145]
MPLSRWLTLIPALAAIAPARSQVLPTRLNIDLVYAQSTDRNLEEHVRQWVFALQEKVQNILAWDASLRLAAGDRIQVAAAPQASLPSANLIKQRWEQRNAIQIVVGHGSRSTNFSTFQGNIFLGRLNGRLPIAIPINQHIEGGSYERSSNFVIVVALYALSVDSAGTPSTSCRLLQQAGLLANALPPTLTSVDVVKAGIQADLRSRCRGRA